MTTRRRYTFPYPGASLDDGHLRILTTLETACILNNWFADPQLDEPTEPAPNFTFNVLGRDRWWVHRRAMRLAIDCFYTIGMDERAVQDPTWVALPPHTNRGRHRIMRQQP